MTRTALNRVVGATTAALVLSFAGSALAAEAQRPIQDNSFLIEEAYNQEPGVIQHISVLEALTNGKGWSYNFTEEWPVMGQINQLSVTVPVMNASGALGLGDLNLSYRYQAFGSGDTAMAFSPRLSLVLPTGAAAQGFGTGAVGYQVNLPYSALLGSSFVSHWNLGATYTPGASNTAGQKADALGYNVGGSLIWLMSSSFNPMLEVVWQRTAEVTATAQTASKDRVVVNPGFRYAMNFGEAQTVFGLSAPIGVGPSAGDLSVLGYLSVEHPLF